MNLYLSRTYLAPLKCFFTTSKVEEIPTGQRMHRKGCVSEVTLTRMIKTKARKMWLYRKMLRMASDHAMTERDSMPVTGFSLKPTEIQPVFCPVITVNLV